MNLTEHSSRYLSQYSEGTIVQSEVYCRQEKGIFISSDCSHHIWVTLFYGYRGFLPEVQWLGVENNSCYLVLKCMELYLHFYTRL
jgi:hypothetical protein